MVIGAGTRSGKDICYTENPKPLIQITHLQNRWWPAPVLGGRLLARSRRMLIFCMKDLLLPPEQINNFGHPLDYKRKD
jgi:hypothetical protein